MWSWVLHRITGVLTFFFLFVHVLDTALVRVSPNAYDAIIETYKTPLVNLMEVGLVGAVLYHALNGIRVILVDFWSKGAKYQRVMLWSILGVWVLVMIPGTYFMLERTVSELLGGGN
ncbi:succinate dehydrogenase subunit C [Saccharomonospora azurea SZMC 14600]|nr:succinate dehydrogenase subunit C [Saccharomonospora azurea SZMC 14600]